MILPPPIILSYVKYCGASIAFGWDARDLAEDLVETDLERDALRPPVATAV